jgi:rare lipoprotein A
LVLKLKKTYLFCLLLSLYSQEILAQKKLNYRNVPVVDSAIGYASYYSDRFIGKKTANGEIFSQQNMTCAHNTLPMGTLVKVTSLKNGQFVIVRVNDRLHRHNPRLVDLSKAAAAQLGFIKQGIIKVNVVVVKDENVEKKVTKE